MKFCGWIVSILIILGMFFMLWTAPKEPEIHRKISTESIKVEKLNDHFYRYRSNYLKKNEWGIWEMYVEGTPYERGVVYGALAQELIQHQEDIFVGQIKKMLPGKITRKTIKYFVRFFNRDMDAYIPDEYQKEIFGVSQAFSDKNNFVGPKYQRVLNYHAAHDIGHALQDLNIVGCSAFSVKGNYTEKGQLMLGRNFDFYMGEDFSKTKLLLFMKPDSGYRFMSYSWAGFMGVASGMNEKGLTVTINAAKSDIPLKAKTPISLLAREILQYASNTAEAIDIARHRETFVSEAIMIGSASENKSIIIEKTPERISVYDSGKDVLIGTNHYQSKAFRNDKINLDNIQNSDSKYRYDRLKELIEENQKLDIPKMARILRNQKGIQNDEQGMANPRAINQLIGHHSIIFEPIQRNVWVSTLPNILGVYKGYNLNQMFQLPDSVSKTFDIEEDPFLHSKTYTGFPYFLKTKESIQDYVLFGKKFNLNESDVKKFIRSNPESYLPYFMLGVYFQKKDEKQTARAFYTKSLTYALPSPAEKKAIEKRIKETLK